MPNYLGSYDKTDGSSQAIEIFAPTAEKAERKARKQYGPTATIAGTLLCSLAEIPYVDNDTGEKNG